MRKRRFELILMIELVISQAVIGHGRDRVKCKNEAVRENEKEAI